MDLVAKGKEIVINDKPIKKTLQLSLKEIFYGGMKKIKIRKLIFADAEKSHTFLKEKILTVPIKPGLPTGTEIIFTEEGDQRPNRIPADIIFTTEDKTHEIYKREGDNLLMTVDIVLKDALLGTIVTVHTLDDRTFRVPITSITTPDYRKYIPGEGLPFLQNPNERGDLIINFKIDFPIYLSVASKNYMKKAFDNPVKDVTNKIV
ncbi:dnaJ homolog subfamily B member 13-like [Chelonus insularis]|uniref:dnaJ homolog subfamily B member 13-like n=1 Tax=Chelonus insularis TaxID=460826 RepID=UPI00158C3545|nr:dnaJ homolog subfamily B member 13-like [Chelonus insularis]XP_034943848.1 dnaJ homolog subfamily B member 13-like [Chelonus insularis]XP_034943849.1 dnaJ homolog subfamily B member 13-like [Chelonus insularis]XP_034943850.1 dnaJ homolog subfamily B member 13-like [Chelonus insularis]XP_034943851.1 dnaJ homolog subfamily B member 13-like [Chelonus insularis]XP_034943852.1 dnaJ homolog subfamily B member 13-like [Chelonus insularis]XP_034943854.1 dnaJ homolog subfamily B member 13-like [Che